PMISGHGSSRCAAFVVAQKDAAPHSSCAATRQPPSCARSCEVDEALARSDTTFRSPRMFDVATTDAVEGSVCWKPVKSLWITGMTLAALIGGPVYFTWGALALFLATTAATVCLGHSLGMHRRLIHRAYGCSLWLERLLVYLGTLVGMAGPYGMICPHDPLGWGPRQRGWPPHLAPPAPFLPERWWATPF